MIFVEKAYNEYDPKTLPVFRRVHDTDSDKKQTSNVTKNRYWHQKNTVPDPDPISDIPAREDDTFDDDNDIDFDVNLTLPLEQNGVTINKTIDTTSASSIPSTPAVKQPELKKIMALAVLIYDEEKGTYSVGRQRDVIPGKQVYLFLADGNVTKTPMIIKKTNMSSLELHIETLTALYIVPLATTF